MSNSLILWFKECSYKNKDIVGGKCSSLGELYYLSRDITFDIADGFSITTNLYDEFIKEHNLIETIKKTLDNVDTTNIEELNVCSDKLKQIITQSKMSDRHISIIKQYYYELCNIFHGENDTLEVAVRSSAVAEDLPNASFAGQQDTYLNIKGIDNLIPAIVDCFASLFNSRAISYRKTNNICFEDVKISVAIQKMVRSDIGSAGVAFSIDPETGYNKAIVINSSFGLGELVVSGGVKPDEFILDKRILKDIESDPIISKMRGEKNTKIVYDEDGGVKEITTTDKEKNMYSLTNNQTVALGRYVLLLEKSYSKLLGHKIGIDVEWAIDGSDHKIYIIQARPETIHSNDKNNHKLTKYRLLSTTQKQICSGVSVGSKISSGKVKLLTSVSQYASFNEGDILVTDMTTPDWEPIMKIASGIITNKGGRTCHAAIVAREMGLNALVGCGNATEVLKSNIDVTINCSNGETGVVYEGIIDYTIDTIEVSGDTKMPVDLLLNIGNPETSFVNSLLPNKGVGLVRMEFIVTNYIKAHPLALFDYPNISDEKIKKQIFNVIGNDHHDGKWFFTKRLARGLSKIASAFYPNEVIVRLSDFKSNEYRNLIGGSLYEPNEENPMIGWRGASRYYSDEYKDGFELECKAIRYAREKMKMDNIVVMIPFCRTPEECKLVIDSLKSCGLVRGENNLKIYLMCEIPSNVIEADHFSPLIDGVSIGGNDLLQLTLGVDRDSDRITHLSNDKNLSYRRMISMAIKTYKSHGVKVGFCGQQPSDSIEFCKFLINEDIDTISVTPDSAINTITNIGK